MRSLLSCACLALIAGCGDAPPPGPGDQTFTPPSEQTGGGRPSGATEETCVAADDCSYWYCRCGDGAIVNSALCVNGYCMDAASACPDACEYFGHGAWTGEAGGGPGSTTGTCGGLGSSGAACDACFRDACCEEGEACGAQPSCLDYWDCAVPCGGDAGCRAECDARYPAGAAPYRALESCLVASCSEACGGLS
jgi:hypothetical protein